MSIEGSEPGGDLKMSTRERIKNGKNIAGNKLHRRLDYARFLLTQTGVSLEQVAASCGWANEKKFVVAFQAEVGVSPGHYRKWHRG